jgi:thiamine biosynthesis lipoprotein
MRRQKRAWGVCLLALFLLAGCSKEVAPEQLSGATMGTTWHLSYLDSPQDVTPEQVQQGFTEVLERINDSMSTYREDSEISRFNAREPNSWVTTSPAFFHVLTTALDVGKRSEGAYDVTVAPLVNLWGFGPGPATSQRPDNAAIAAARERVGQQHLRMDNQNFSVLKETALSLDFSSLAKGYAVDELAKWLLDHGIERFMVEVGGELRLAGMSGRGDPWRIGIEQPDDSGRAVAATLQLTNVGMATSGDYRNYFEVDGRRYSHLIDPRTGYPVAHDLVSVTVVHPDCMLADAWATALTVLGAEQAMSVAQAQGLAVYFIRRVDDGFVHSHTPLFAPYLVEAAR